MNIPWEIKRTFKTVRKNPYTALIDWGLNPEQVSEYISYQQKYDAIEYFIWYVRYLKLIKMTYSEKSKIWKLILMLNEWDSKNGFVICRVTKLKKEMIRVSISFVDLVKVLIILDLKEKFWLNNKALQLIFLSLRYHILCMAEWKDCKLSGKTFLYMHDITMNNEWWQKREVDKYKDVKAIRNEIKSKEAYANIKYTEDVFFEKALFYALKFRKSVYLYVNLNNSLEPVKYFTNGSDMWLIDDWIHVNLLRSLSKFSEIQWNENPSYDIMAGEWIYQLEGPHRKKKEKYIEWLTKKITKMLEDKHLGEVAEDTEILNHLMNKRDKADIEETLSFFDVNDWEEWYADRKKDIDDFLIYGINWEYLIDIANWEVKYATNNFSTSNLSKEKYEELKLYTADYWHVVPDKDAMGIPKRYVWQKRYKYWKKQDDD